MKDILPFETVALDDANDALVLIDQTKLPNEVVMLRLKKLGDIREAIRKLTGARRARYRRCRRVRAVSSTQAKQGGNLCIVHDCVESRQG